MTQVDGSKTRARFLALTAGVIVATCTYVAMSPRDGKARIFGVSPMILGVAVKTTGDPRVAEAEVRVKLREHLAAPITLRFSTGLGGETFEKTTSRGALGATIDDVRLASLLRDVRDPSSPLMRAAPHDLALPVPIALDPAKVVAALTAIKDDLDKPAEDAKLDLDARKVVPEADGRRVDVYGTIAALDRALASDQTVILAPAVRVTPTLTKEALGDVDLSQTLGWFETKYATDAKHGDRTFNLRLAASKLNGKVVMPGETFDFNGVVGARDEAHGYRVAKVIADGELVDGIGGGTCQIAGTLHGAALFAGMDVVKRSPHTRPSWYIKMGLDAAVAYPSVNLKLKNPFPFPIVLKETVTGGVVRAEVLGPKRSRLVTFIRKIREVIPYPEKTLADDKLADGVKVLVQRGVPGFKIDRYRIVREGANAIREKTTDSYPPTSQIWHVGTGGKTMAKPSTDDHPEFVADVYLSITQGQGVGKHGMEELRIAGETGVHGWSKKYASASEAVIAKELGEVDPAEATAHDESEDAKPPAKHPVAHKK